MLDIVGDIMSWVIILVEVISAVILFNSMLSRRNTRYNAKITYIIEIIVLFTFTYLLANIDAIVLIDFIVFPLMYFAITSIFYKSKIILKLGFSVIFYAMLYIIEFFTFFMLNTCLSISNEEILENPLLFFIAAMICKSIHLLIIIAFRKIIAKRYYYEYISVYHWLIYIIQSIITTLTLFSIMRLSAQSDHIPAIAIISSTGLLFLNIATFVLLESFARQGNDIRENALLKRQIEVELDDLKSLSQAFGSQRETIHDYQHNLNILYQLLDTEKYEQALQYIQTLSENFYHTLYRIKTDHNIIDAILNLKDLQATRSGITLDIRAGNLSNVSIPDDLLVTIMSNTIDNAIEACKDVLDAKKIVSVKCVNEEGLLIFSVINPVKNPVKIVDNMITTTKNDKSVHGIGLKNVAAALSKCNGDYELFYRDFRFQFTAFVRLTS